MKRINILHVVGGMDRGGAETFLMNILRNIDKEKFNFIFLCYGNKPFDYENEIRSLGAKIIRTPDIKNVGIFKHIHNIEKIIKDEKICIVHAHTHYNSMFSLIAAKRSKVKTRISHSHSTKSEQNPSLIKKIYFIFSKLVINIYANNYLACAEDAGHAIYYKKNRFTVVDNGIILNDFYFNDSSRELIRRTLSIADGTTVIGHVGRFDTAKNHMFLLDVFGEYTKINDNTTLLLVGDGRLKNDIHDKVKSLNLQDKVIFMGVRDDINKIYSAMDIFLFPSLYEGLGIALIEAQTNGLPCLTSNVIDPITQITERIHYYPLDKGPISWADKIKTINLAKHKRNLELVSSTSRYNVIHSIKLIEGIYSNSHHSGETL